MDIISYLKKAVKRLINYMGYEISPLHIVSKSSNKYERITPNAGFAPWNVDIAFLKVYDIVKDYTLVDKYRCYELWKLVSQSLQLGGAIIEVGVWKGGTGGLICKSVELGGKNNTVYLADTFQGVVKASPKDYHYRGGEHADTSPEIVHYFLENKLHLNNFKILKGIFPEETSHLINDSPFCFCHIDVDVYNSAKEVTDWIWPLLTIGGIIVYDDYGFEGCNGVTDFVDNEMYKRDRIVIYNLNGHAIVIKVK